MNFLNPEYDHNEVHVSSTHIARTLQSARSHMMGLFGVRHFNVSPDYDDYINSYPHIELSEDYINDTFSQFPDNYDPVPIYNNDLSRDLIYSSGSCPYLGGMRENRIEEDSYWTKYDNYFKPRIYHKISEILQIDEDMKFTEAYNFGDALLSLEFEGIISQDNFTKQEWKDLQNLQLPFLLNSFSNLGNKMMISKLFNPIFEMMLTHLGQSRYPNLIESFQGIKKYILYSSHDLQISHLLKFFKPENIYVDYIPYASNFIFELYKADNGTDYIKIFYNNEQLKMPYCSNIDCDFDEFIEFYKYVALTPEELISLCNLS